MQVQYLTTFQWLCGLAILLLAGCSDYLDLEPLALQTEDLAFKDESTARLVVNSMYDPLIWGEISVLSSPSSHAYEFIFGDICSDDSEKGSTFSDQADIQRLKTFNTDGGNDNVASVWNNHFVAISRANLVLKNLSDSPLPANVKAEFEGEARFVRAYSYFLLARVYGHLPLLREPVTPEQINAQSFTREPLYRVYELIEEDLRVALDNLPQRGVREPGRANKGAAAAYLARVIMYQIGTDNTNGKSWQEVLDWTDRFIAGEFGTYALAENYAEIFEFEGENNIGSIFELQAIDNGGDNGDRNLIGPGGGSEWTVFQNPQNFGGWGFNTPTADLANAYEPNDPRRPATTIAVGEFAYGQELLASERNQTGYYTRKAIIEPDQWITQKGSGANQRKFRYADILLMNAEAAYHTGDNAKAIQRLSEIRERASQSTLPKGFDPNDPSGYPRANFAPLDNNMIPSSGQALLDFIYLERRREFGMEQLRFWDLVRTGRYFDAIRNSYQDFENPDNQNFGNEVAEAAMRHTIVAEPGQVLVNPIPVFPIPVVDAEGWGIEQNPNY